MGNGVSGSSPYNTFNSTRMGNSKSRVNGESDKGSSSKVQISWHNEKERMAEKTLQALLTELQITKQKLKDKDFEIEKLKGEIHKLKSVIDIKIHRDGKPDLLATIQEEAYVVGQGVRTKKQGVSGESTLNTGGTSALLQHFDKDFRSKQVIKDAVLDNDFLKNLDSIQIREIVDCMYEKKIAKGQYVIKEGDAGQHLYVSAEGSLEVSKGDDILGNFGAGHAFGELAILYNCTRTASVRAKQETRIWVLDRRVFQAIMLKTGLEWQEEKIQFLKSVPLLKDLQLQKLAKIADVLEVDIFHEGEYIIRENAIGNTFFIINKGQVRVTQQIHDRAFPQEVRILKRGDYFGEKALLSEDRRTASVIAMPPGVECLTLERNDFIQLIGSLSELLEKDYGDDQRGAQRLPKKIAESSGSETSLTSRCSNSRPDSVLPGAPDVLGTEISLEDLEIVATLGMGGFGRVELVQLCNDKTKTFALKCLKKVHIVSTNQQEHVFSEKRIMMAVRSPFIARMYQTFKDKKYVYMLMEVCLGGELWTILRDRGHFDDIIARFCTACVLEAFEYLHSKGIIYRDLKPENLLLSNDGYVKLVDFGFAKKIGYGRKTWTFCGTPEYVAPEIILNKGHDHAVDYWSLGILMFELLTGSPPFSAGDAMKTYNLILRGVDLLEFSKRIGRTPQALIKKLCKDNPSERLGYGKNGIRDIKTHKWFQGFDWEGLKNQSLHPPLVPKVRGPGDHSNYDSYPKDLEIPPDETSGWDNTF